MTDCCVAGCVDVPVANPFGGTTSGVGCTTQLPPSSVALSSCMSRPGSSSLLPTVHWTIQGDVSEARQVVVPPITG